MSANVTRRFFIGSGIAWGSLAGCRAFGAPSGSCVSGTPKLTFGVLSDIHVRCGEYGQGTETLESALKWFCDHGVDAVMITGDLTDSCLKEELESVASAWRKVFPNDRAPDGRRVERLFIYGNHDFDGYLYMKKAEQVYPDKAELGRHLLRTDMAGWWRKIFDEDYSRYYLKTVKGYAFVGGHWDDGSGLEARFGHYDAGAGLEDFLAAHRGEIDPKTPFFYFQHPHLKNTCHGSWAWGHDRGSSTAALLKYPNAIAFSGHSHYSISDERAIWQGGFTSVGAASLRYITPPFYARLPFGYENTSAAEKRNAEFDPLKVMDRISRVRCPQGMLWRVFTDRIVVERHEFLRGLSLGDDWVLPLPVAESAPFSFTARARKSIPPQFASDAVLIVRRVSASTRATKGRPAKNVDAVSLVFPPALRSHGGARPFEYEVAAVTKDDKRQTYNFLADDKSPLDFRIATSRLPKGTVRFEVRALDCWWNPGGRLSANLKWDGAILQESTGESTKNSACLRSVSDDIIIANKR